MVDLDLFERLPPVSVGCAFSTFRVRITNGLTGDLLRIRFSNQYGNKPLTLGEVSIAISVPGSADIVPGTSTPVTFGGTPGVTLGNGETRNSDPVAMAVKAGEELSVSYYVPRRTRLNTVSLFGGYTYAMTGKHTTAAKPRLPIPMFLDNALQLCPFLVGVDVYSDGYAIVLFGDSITMCHLPDIFARRIRNTGVENVSVINMGITANRLLSLSEKTRTASIFGDAALDRFARDVLELPGARYVSIKIGLNDLAHPYLKSLQGMAQQVAAAQVIDGNRQLAAASEAAGIAVVFAPYTGTKGYVRDLWGTGNDDLEWTEELQEKITALNTYYDIYNAANGVTVDLSGMNSPDDPYRLDPKYTKDGCHFNILGQETAAGLLPLAAFGVTGTETGEAKNIESPSAWNRLLARLRKRG
ncbi:MAG: hypothetical protein LBS96_02725 [Oscillospiraceae bacterium]|jgi:lysophospholipase L1-like esterase|nr:hypothetical protein [Oscillospiraceae bacterium]